MSDQDANSMRAALTLARRGLGNVWPNPAVGCVIVKDGHVVGRGWTQPGGRPHAETEALRRAGAAAQGATAYVTLEPCSHWGLTPPCAAALIAAGISRVVVAIGDPDPRVAGAGLARLRAAGVAVEEGLCGAEAGEINAGFFSRIRLGRPLVTLKLATSLDGRIATADGDSRWITGAAARERAHLLRAENDGVLIGTNTAIADDPRLTCRLPGLEGHSPVRIVIDRLLRVPPGAQVFDTRMAPSWVVTASGTDPKRQQALREAGVTLIKVDPGVEGAIDPAIVLRLLGERGLTRLLVEGGGRLAAALLQHGLVDRLAWFHAPILLGGDAIPAVAGLGLAAVAAAPQFERLTSATLGADRMTMFRARRYDAEPAR